MSEDPKKVAILGCGWLGIPLAEQLIRTGYEVRGTTTTPEKLEVLRSKGIEPFLIEVTANQIKGNFDSFISDVEVLIIDFPPGIRRQPAEEYIRSISLLVQKIKTSSVRKVLFVSSISVYEDKKEFPVYTEKNKPNATSSRGKGLISAEDLLDSDEDFKTTILRFGGLIGEARHPIHQLSGRKNIANAEAPINLISLIDCIEIIEAILQQNRFGECFNAVYPEHPAKGEYYVQKAREKALPPPEYSGDISKGKIIESRRIQEILNYNYKERP